MTAKLLKCRDLQSDVDFSDDDTRFRDDCHPTVIDIVEGVSLGSIGNRACCLNHIEAETPQPFNHDAIRVLMPGFTKGKDVQVVRIEQVTNIIGLLIHRANIQRTEPKLMVNSDQVTLTPWTLKIILQLRRSMAFRFNAG